MARLFDFDNPVWKLMGRVADLFFLTLLWAVCSLPVVTAGASTTALYYVALKMAKNHEGYLAKAFFRSFRENFVLSTVVWAVMAGLGGLLAAGGLAVSRMPVEQSAFFLCALVIFAILYLMTLTMLFPLAARLDTGAGRLFLMAFMTALKNFSWVLLMTVLSLCVAAMGIFVFWPVLFVGAGGIAWVHGLILEHMIFPKYGWEEK